MEIANVTRNYAMGFLFVRMLASLIDYVFLGIISYFIFSLIPSHNSNDLIVILFGSIFAYYIIFESFFGFTIGKLIFRLRVVDENMNPPGILKILLRTFLRFVEANPFILFSLPGLIIISKSINKRRLGDMVANVNVIYMEDIKKIQKEKENEKKIIKEEMWVCQKCKQANRKSSIYCKSCGEYK